MPFQGIWSAAVYTLGEGVGNVSAMPAPQPIRRQYKDEVIELLGNRGVSVNDIAELVMLIQKSYLPNLTMDACRRSVRKVLAKRETQNAIFTGVALDMLAEKGLLPAPLVDMLRQDDGLYGIDEVMALAIVNVYGSIGLTNFGYLDKSKPGVVGRLNDPRSGQVNTFLDDLVSAIAAAAAARLAHHERDVAD